MSTLEVAVKQVLVGDQHSLILGVDAELPPAYMVTERGVVTRLEARRLFVMLLAGHSIGFVLETHLDDHRDR